mgnify:CR=1 FL=1
MGLDMYLNANRFYWFNEEPLKVAEVPDGYKVKEVTVEVAYWRKANAIHQWFVDNVQNGDDDCDAYSVGRGELEKLVDICQQVLADPSKAKDLLPTADGFFFGSTEYDEWYVSALQETVDQVSKALASFNDQWRFEYRSSW